MPDPHKDIGLNILSQFHYGPDVTITTFDTLADAVQSIAAKTILRQVNAAQLLFSFLNRFGFGHVFPFCRMP